MHVDIGPFHGQQYTPDEEASQHMTALLKEKVSLHCKLQYSKYSQYVNEILKWKNSSNVKHFSLVSGLSTSIHCNEFSVIDTEQFQSKFPFLLEFKHG